MDDADFDEDDAAEPRADGGGDEVQGPPLSEESDAFLFEHLQTAERGFMPPEVSDNPALFSIGLPVFRRDQKAYEVGSP